MHRATQPAILYFGMPVVLISKVNEDGTPNLAPMSSAWWPRALECPVQSAAMLEEVHPIGERDPAWRGRSVALHVAIRKVHAATEILADGEPDLIDPDKCAR